jgi:hypothetical protein
LKLSLLKMYSGSSAGDGVLDAYPDAPAPDAASIFLPKSICQLKDENGKYHRGLCIRLGACAFVRELLDARRVTRVLLGNNSSRKLTASHKNVAAAMVLPILPFPRQTLSGDLSSGNVLLKHPKIHSITI